MPYSGKHWTVGAEPTLVKPNKYKNTGLNHPQKALLLLGHGNEGGAPIPVPPGFIVVVKSHSGDVRNYSDLKKDQQQFFYPENTEYLLDPVSHIDTITKMFGSVSIFREGDLVPDIMNTRMLYWDDNWIDFKIVPSGSIFFPLETKITPYIKSLANDSVTIDQFLEANSMKNISNSITTTGVDSITTTAVDSDTKNFRDALFSFLDIEKAKDGTRPVKPILVAYEKERVSKAINVETYIPKTMTLDEYEAQKNNPDGINLHRVFEFAKTRNGTEDFNAQLDRWLTEEHKVAGKRKKIYNVMNRFGGYLINKTLEGKYPESMSLLDYLNQTTIDFEQLLKESNQYPDYMIHTFKRYLTNYNETSHNLKRVIKNYDDPQFTTMFEKSFMSSNDYKVNQMQRNILQQMSLEVYSNQSTFDYKTSIETNYPKHFAFDEEDEKILEKQHKDFIAKHDEYILHEMATDAGKTPVFESVKALEKHMSAYVSQLFTALKQPTVIYMFACRFIDNHESYVPESVRLGTNNPENYIYSSESHHPVNQQKQEAHQTNTPIQRYLHAAHATKTRKILRNASGKNTGKLVPNQLMRLVNNSIYESKALNLGKNHSNLNLVKGRSRVHTLAPEIKQQISESRLQRRLGAMAFNRLAQKRRTNKNYLSDYLVELSNPKNHKTKINRLKKIYPKIENDYVDMRTNFKSTNGLNKDILKTELTQLQESYPQRKNNIQKAINRL